MARAIRALCGARSARRRYRLWDILLCLAAVAAVGCAPAQYAKQADRDAYAALAGGQKAALGEAKPFTIDYKPYASASQPSSIQLGQRTIELSAEKPQVLSLEEVLEIAFRNSREYQGRKEGLFVTALALANSRRGWDLPKFEGSVDADATRTIVQRGGEPVNAGAVSATPSLAQQLANGGRLGLAATLNLATDFLGMQSTTIGSVVSGTFTQPLLRGAWHEFAYEPQYRLERDFLFAVFDYERQRQTFAADIVSQYYSVLQQRDQLENQSTQIKRLKETLGLTRTLVGAGQVSPIEQDQAEQDLINAQVSYQQDQQAYQDLLDRFKLSLGLPLRANVELDYPAALTELGQAGPKPIPFEQAQAVDIALSVRPDLLSERAKVRDAARDVELAANNFLPQLDVTLGISAPSTPPHRLTRLQFDRNTRTAAVAFDYALDQTGNRDAYRSALIGYLRAQRELSAFLDNVRLEVRQSYRALLQSKTSYDLQLKSVQIAKRRTKLAALQQKEGEASARDVLEAEEAMRQAQNGLTSALVGYTTTRLDFLSALGMLEVDEKGRIHERTEPFRFNRIAQQYPYTGAE